MSTGSDTCTDYGAGTYSAATGAVLCISYCGAGTYSTELGASSSMKCSACPSNFSSLAGSANCADPLADILRGEVWRAQGYKEGGPKWESDDDEDDDDDYDDAE